MDGEFIRDRKMEQIVAELASSRNIHHETFSNGWVHLFEKNETTARLIGYKWSLNDSAAAGIASDKVALYEVINSRNIPAVEHYLLRTKADTSLPELKDIVYPVVLKPLTGTSAHGVTLCNSARDISEYIRVHMIVAWAIAPFYKIAQEIRVIVLDGTAVLAYEKIQTDESKELKLFNLGKGARAEVCSPDQSLVKLATSAMAAVGLRLGAVDIVRIGNEWKVLEVNDGFMMEHFLRQSGEYYTLTRRVYEQIIDVLFS